MVSEAWADQAACTGRPELFFAATAEEEFEEAGRRESAAMAVCAGCPVREPCLRFAVHERIREGVWGGLRDTERRGLRVDDVPRVAAAWQHTPHRRRRRSRAKAAVAARQAREAGLAAGYADEARSA